jgi:hypothetical protein
MSSPTLYGTYPLTNQGINGAVTSVSAGVYLLGTPTQGGIAPERVGRAIYNVNQRLHDYIGEYTHFAFAYCANAYAAFLAECELWHDFGGKNNPLHPDREKGQDWKCPRCNNFG